jgi:hypothetical protein
MVVEVHKKTKLTESPLFSMKKGEKRVKPISLDLKNDNKMTLGIRRE